MQVSVFWIKYNSSIILAAMLIDAQRVRLRELSNIATSEKIIKIIYAT